MSIEKRIEKALIRYLAAEHNIKATVAYLDDTSYNSGSFSGCETCGYGADEAGMSFDIAWRDDTMTRTSYVTVDGDPLGFFPTLYDYDEDE